MTRLLIQTIICWHSNSAPRWAAPALLPSPSPLLQGRRRKALSYYSTHTQHTHSFRLELKLQTEWVAMNCLLPLHWTGLYTPIHVPFKVQFYLLHTPKVQGWNQPTTTLVPAIQLVYLYLYIVWPIALYSTGPRIWTAMTWADPTTTLCPRQEEEEREGAADYVLQIFP